MTTHTHRRASTPAYYLGRPAAFWLAALAASPTAEHESCAGDDVLLVSEPPRNKT